MSGEEAVVLMIAAIMLRTNVTTPSGLKELKQREVEDHQRKLRLMDLAFEHNKNELLKSGLYDDEHSDTSSPSQE
jgi:hypothetical protein